MRRPERGSSRSRRGTCHPKHESYPRSCPVGSFPPRYSVPARSNPHTSACPPDESAQPFVFVCVSVMYRAPESKNSRRSFVLFSIAWPPSIPISAAIFPCRCAASISSAVRQDKIVGVPATIPLRIESMALRQYAADRPSLHISSEHRQQRKRRQHFPPEASVDRYCRPAGASRCHSPPAPSSACRYGYRSAERTSVPAPPPHL